MVTGCLVVVVVGLGVVVGVVVVVVVVVVDVVVVDDDDVVVGADVVTVVGKFRSPSQLRVRSAFVSSAIEFQEKWRFLRLSRKTLNQLKVFH